MKLKMAPNSLFAVLLRSPWWYSLGLAVGYTLLVRVMVPPQYFLLGAMGTLPILGIGCVAAWRQFKAPSPKRVAATLEAVQAMSWREFAATLEAAFVREGYAVEKLDSPAADFMLTKSSRSSLVSARRWKAASLGVEPLRELQVAGDKREAQECVYIALGGISDNALNFAKAGNIRVLRGPELAVLLQK